MVELILASNSPRRKKILSDMGLEYKIIPSNYDEKLESDDFDYDKIEDLATNNLHLVNFHLEILYHNPQQAIFPDIHRQKSSYQYRWLHPKE